MNKEEWENYKELSSEITEKLDNTAEYESWLIIQEYIDRCQQENQKLKKQLENCYCNRTDCSSRIKNGKKYDSLVQKVEKQQKEFMEWLESKITEHKILIYGEDELNECLSITKEAFELALLKYKEIIGDK